MTTIFYAEPELVVALNRKIIFVNPNDLQIFKEVELPSDLIQCGLKVQTSGEPATDEAGDQSETATQKKKNQKEPQPLEAPTVQHVALAPDHQLLAVTTAGQKALLLYKCRMEHAKLVSVRSLARTSSALAFSSDSKTLLVTDKTGDCYLYNCVELEAPPRLLLGHLSIVYDVLWSADAKYIITCDRDDKIRITNYPATHDIHGYCLGHKEFVAGISLLDNEVLISVSGDKTLRLWHFESGKELTKFELPAPGIRLAVQQLESNKYQAAVLLHQPDECVGLYELSKDSASSWHITERQVLKFPGIIASNLCFAEQRLYISGILDDHFVLKVAALTDNSKPVPDNWLQMIEAQFSQEIWKPEDISAWFKKRYDNVSEYLERKKRRIEEKQK